MMSTLKHIGLALILLTTLPAHAAYSCRVHPQSDVVLTPQSIEVISPHEVLQISSTGDIMRNGKVLSLTPLQRQKAQVFQNTVRKDLPWIENNAQQHLKNAYNALDHVVVKQLGKDSKVRTRLTRLDTQLKQQMARILEQQDSHLIFHHKAVAQVASEGQDIVQQALGGILQDSLNEISQQKTISDNPLQAIIGQLGGLQQSIQSTWGEQEYAFDRLGKEICQRATDMEQQRHDLMHALNANNKTN